MGCQESIVIIEEEPLQETNTIGVLMIDEYPDPGGFALGDMANKDSFSCPVIFEIVKGLNFQKV